MVAIQLNPLDWTGTQWPIRRSSEQPFLDPTVRVTGCLPIRRLGIFMMRFLVLTFLSPELQAMT